ncbi:MAG: HlyD family efflux transporter periplasmic adaptor subunit, partial [Pseudobacteriovorax sp.]|nr:HlyD family efflux transporter periplasmic adaptor subunit [Pseudobacteriovorax sp.]
MSRKDLFRQEVQEELNFGKMGEVILLPNPKSSVLVYLLFSIFAVIFLFLAFANYNEKQKVAGIVVPDKGIIKVFPKREGVVQDIRVKEGQRIQEGDQIASLVNHVSLEGGDSVQLLQKKNLEAIHQNIETTLANLPKRKQIEFDELSTRHKQSLKEIKLLESQLGILRERVKLLKTRTTQLKTLQASALISTHEFEQSKDRLLSLQQLQKQKEEDILAKKTVVHSLASTIENLDYKYDELKVTQEKELSGVASQIAEISAGYSRIVKAPISGRVATVQGSLGHRITNQKPLVTLLPDDSLWEAHLYVPSRAIGKVEVGK